MGLKKKVIQFKNGEQVAVFDSATEAGNAIGVTKDRISKCCIGKEKSVKGYTFKYTGEFTNQQKYDGGYKCPYCDMGFDTYNGLCKHVIRNKSHGDGISKEKLLADFKYNGIRPVCKCGCGEYTDISYQGGAHFVDYKWGHASRIHNDWGLSEVGNKFYRDLMRRRLSSGKFSISSKIEKRFIEECIKPLGIEYNTQFYIKELRHYCDVYIPSKNTIVEFNGDYWHGNPKKFTRDELSDYQLKKVKKDEELRKYCSENNINLIEVWESDFNKDKDGVKTMLSESISI